MVLKVVVGLVALKWVVQMGLEALNRKSVLANAGSVPAAFADVLDEGTYRKATEYSLARIRFDMADLTWQAAVLLALLLSGILPAAFHWFGQSLGHSAWAGAAFLVAAGVALSLPGLPFEWYHQFRLEARFGFNTTTYGTWLMDHLKGLLLTVLLGCPLLWLVLKLAEWTGQWWWLWAWAAVLGFQLLMVVLAPVLILPLFNKLTPLPEGALRARLLRLAERTKFKAASIQVMDGSKRSRHSNAFFTGFGRLRKIVLFDTLMEQLSETELEAVLAHEIGHYKKGHIPKTLALFAGGALVGFYVLAFLASETWFYQGFGFRPGSLVPALLLFGMLSGLATFWVSPVSHAWSRRNEYEADAYAIRVMGERKSLIGALRKLNQKNLSNLTPHPLYSEFYYSHPTLLERERSIRSLK